MTEVTESRLRSDGVEYLQVETLGPSRVSDGYARTRHFCEACGFAPLEEIHGLWDEGNPCLILVKHLSYGEGSRRSGVAGKGGK
jgi:hypothetical protein